MKINVRKVSIISLSLFIASLSLFLVKKQILNYLKFYFETKISKVHNLHAKMHSISFKLPNKLLLNNLVVLKGGNPIFITKQLQIKISPITYLKTKWMIDSYNFISPIIFIENLPVTMRQKPSLISFSFKNANIVTKDFRVDGLHGKIDSLGEQIKFSLLKKNIELSGTLNFLKDGWLIHSYINIPGIPQVNTSIYKQTPSNLITIEANANIIGSTLTTSGIIEYQNGVVWFKNFKIDYRGILLDGFGKFMNRTLSLTFLSQNGRRINLVYLYPKLLITTDKEDESITIEGFHKKVIAFSGKFLNSFSSGTVNISETTTANFIVENPCISIDSNLKFSKNRYELNVKFKKIRLPYIDIECFVHIVGEKQKEIIEGNLEISRISLNKFQLEPVIANFCVSKNSAEVIAKSDNLFGKIFTDFHNISGKFSYDFKKAKGIISIHNTLANPSIKFTYDLEELCYGDYILSIKGKGELANKIINAEFKGKIKSETLSTDVEGILYFPSFLHKDIRGHLKFINLSHPKIRIDELKTDFFVSSDKLYLKDAVAKSKKDYIKFSCLYDFKKKCIKIKSKLYNLHYHPFSFCGSLDIYCESEKDFYKGYITSPNFWVNQYYLEIPKLDFYLSSSTLTFQSKKQKIFGKIAYEKNKTKIGVSSEKIQLECNFANGKVNGYLSGKNISIQDIASLLNIKTRLKGNTTFTARITGTTAQPKILTDLAFFDFTVHTFNLGNGTAKITLFKNSLEIKKLTAQRNGLQINLSAILPIGLLDSSLIGKPIFVNLKIPKADLSIIKDISEEIEKAEGSICGEVTIKGIYPKYSSTGKIEIKNGKVSFVRYMNEIYSINGTLKCEKERMIFDEISGRVKNYGNVKLTGYIKFKGFTVDECQLKFMSDEKGILVKIPEWPLPTLIKTEQPLQPSQANVTVITELKKIGNKLNLSGNIEVKSARISYPLSTEKELPQWLKLPQWLSLSLYIKLAGHIWHETETAKLKIKGELNLNSKDRKIFTNGYIQALAGTIRYLGNDFKVKHMEIEIKGNKLFIELMAQTKLLYKGEKQTVNLIVEKTPYKNAKPKFTTSSGEEITKLEEIFTEDMGLKPDITPEERDFILRQQLVKLIDATLTTPLARSLLREFPIVDDITVSHTPEKPERADLSQISLLDLIKGTKYTVEKYLSPDLLIAYSISLGELHRRLSLKHEIEIAYKLKGNLLLRGIYELASVESATRPDRRIMLEHFWRFKW